MFITSSHNSTAVAESPIARNAHCSLSQLHCIDRLCLLSHSTSDDFSTPVGYSYGNGYPYGGGCGYGSGYGRGCGGGYYAPAPVIVNR